MQKVFFTLLLALSANYVDAKNVLFTATYKGEYSGWNITLTRQLTEENGVYQFESEAKNLFASMLEISTFSIKEKQLSPRKYLFQRKIFGKKTVEVIDFDWQKLQAKYSRSDRAKNNTTHKLQGVTLDPSLYQLCLQADIANQQQALNYTFIKRKRTEHYQFKAEEVSHFTFAKKRLDAVVVTRQDAENDKKNTRVWLLPALDYQIAKIIHRDADGDTFEIELVDYQGDSQVVSSFYQKLADSKSADTHKSTKNRTTQGQPLPDGRP